MVGIIYSCKSFIMNIIVCLSLDLECSSVKTTVSLLWNCSFLDSEGQQCKKCVKIGYYTGITVAHGTNQHVY